MFRVALDVRAGYQAQLEAQPVEFMESVAVQGGWDGLHLGSAIDSTHMFH